MESTSSFRQSGCLLSVPSDRLALRHSYPEGEGSELDWIRRVSYGSSASLPGQRTTGAHPAARLPT